MTVRWSKVLGAAGGLVLLTGLGACGSTPPKLAAQPAPDVALDELVSVHSQLKVGVIVTGEPGAVGYQDLPLAAGAVVAQFRLDQAGTTVVLDTVDDHGTAAGAMSAVAQLVSDGVGGIVYASEGPQVVSGVTAAVAARVPVLLPYETSLSGLPEGAWLTGPDSEQVDTALGQFLSSQHASNPILITDALGMTYGYQGGSSQVVQITSTDTQQDVDASVSNGLKAMHLNGTSPTAVILADATDAAEAVAALQAAGVIQILVGPSALSPVFGQKLSAVEASTDGDATTDSTFYSVGEDVYDSQTTVGMAAFLSSLRLAAASGSAKALGNSNLCFGSGGAATADTRSQDAVVALAAAAEAADSTHPESILSELSHGLTVTTADGVAGPDLNFSSQDALADEPNAVVPEGATSEADSARASFDQSCPDGISAPDAYKQPLLTWYAISGLDG